MYISKPWARLLLILLNNVRNLYISCINVDMDELLLLDKNRTNGSVSVELILFVILDELFWFIILFYSFSFCFLSC